MSKSGYYLNLLGWISWWLHRESNDFNSPQSKVSKSTLCLGQACSMGSLLLAAGAKNKRYALRNGRIMIHQPSGGYHGQATDIEIHARETLKLKSLLNNLYSKHTNRNVREIEKNLERDNFMSPEQAIDFGLIDSIIEHGSDIHSNAMPTEKREKNNKSSGKE